MIINTAGRTDTAQYYPKWLLKRFEEGYVYSRNLLFPNKVTRYELTPDVVDCVVFCSKNYAPILPDLPQITDRFNTYFRYTITAYGKEIEPGVPSIEASIKTLKQLSALVGKQRVAWRYDPILLTDKYTIKQHIATFSYMAEQLSDYVDRCIFSFVGMYKKLEQNIPELISMTVEDKNVLAEELGGITQRNHLCLQTCSTNGDFSRFGIHASGCMTLDYSAKQMESSSFPASTRDQDMDATALKAGILVCMIPA